MNWKTKIRPMVGWLSLCLTVLTIYFIHTLFGWLGDFESTIWTFAAIAGLATLVLTSVGVVLGGMVSTMATVAQDAPPPTVSDAVVLELITTLKERHG